MSSPREFRSQDLVRKTGRGDHSNEYLTTNTDGNALYCSQVERTDRMVEGGTKVGEEQARSLGEGQGNRIMAAVG